MREYKLFFGVFFNIKINWVFCIIIGNIIKGLIYDEKVFLCVSVFYFGGIKFLLERALIVLE